MDRVTNIGRPIKERISWHGENCMRLIFSCDGSKIAAAYTIERVRYELSIYDSNDLNNNNNVITCQGHTGEVTSLAFSPDGSKLVSGSKDQTARIWDVATGQEIRLFQFESPVKCVAFSPNGTRIAFGSGPRLSIWNDTEGLTALNTDSTLIPKIIQFSPDSSKLAFVPHLGSGQAKIHLWDVETSHQLKEFITSTYLINTMIFSPDGNSIIIGHRYGMTIYDIASGEKTFLQGGQEIPAITVLDGGRYALTATTDTVRTWDLVQHRCIRVAHLTYEKLFNDSLAISSDGTQVLGSTWGGTYKYDMTKCELWSVERHKHSDSWDLYPDWPAIVRNPTTYVIFEHDILRRRCMYRLAQYLEPLALTSLDQNLRSVVLSYISHAKIVDFDPIQYIQTLRELHLSSNLLDIVKAYLEIRN